MKILVDLIEPTLNTGNRIKDHRVAS